MPCAWFVSLFFLIIANNMLPQLRHIANTLSNFRSKKILPFKLSTRWYNIDSCTKYYRWSTTLYLFAMLSQAYNVKDWPWFIVTGHGREVVDGLNATYRKFLFQLMSTVKLTGKKGYDTQMVMLYETSTAAVSLVQEFQKNLSNASRKHGMIDQGKYKNNQINKNLLKGSILCRRILMLLTKMLRCFVHVGWMTA